MKSLHRSLRATVRYLVFLVRQLAGSNNYLYQQYYSASRYSALKMPQILSGLFEPAGYIVFMSNKIISFGDLAFDVTEKEIIAQQGKPNCMKWDTKETYALRTLFYKDSVGGYETRDHVCLLDNAFFYGCHNFSRGPLLGRNDVKMIRRSLVEKYLSGEEALQATVLERFRIVDSAGNVVVFNNGVNMTISYYGGNATKKEMLRTLYTDLLAASRRELQMRRSALAGKM